MTDEQLIKDWLLKRQALKRVKEGRERNILLEVIASYEQEIIARRDTLAKKLTLN